MLDFLTHLDGKKIAVITVVLLGVVGLLVIMTAKGSTNAPTAGVEKNVTPTKAPKEPVTQKTQDPLPKSYLSDSFALSYPGNWQGKMETLVGGQQVTFIPSSTNSSFPPSITITYDTNPKTIDERTKFYTGNGFQQGTAYVGARQWVKVSSTSPAQGVMSSGGAQRLYETDLLTTYQGQNFTISYKYAATQPDPELENVFRRILNSFEFF